MEQHPLATVGGLAIPQGRRRCPECLGVGVVGTRTRDPQDETSTDCPTCDPHDGTASLGHVKAGR